MPLPYLQVALDNLTLESALESSRILADHVDVLEAGTILCYAAGAPHVVKVLRALHPGKIILADLKVADAGEVLAEMVFSAGATWMTVICSAPLATMKKAHDIARRAGGEIQIELYGNWTYDDAKAWRDIGVKQAVYHRGRDAQAAGQTWSATDIDKARRLSELGLQVSMTGGIEVGDVKLFRDFPVKSFIVGRNLRDCADPAAMAADFKAEFAKYWN